MRRPLTSLMILFIGGCLSLLTSAASAEMRLDKVGEALSHPWGMDFLSRDEMIITTRPGRLVKIALDTGETTPISDVPQVAHFGQGGLLDVSVDGDWLYLCYAKAVGGNVATAIDKARLVGTSLQGRMTLFTSNHQSPSAHHFGCRLVLQDNHLFASLGDRGERQSAQNPRLHSGSIIRLQLDGRPAANAPLKEGWAPEVFSIGHRNPQGLAQHPQSGALYAHEHGPKGGDEINIITAGENYGWPLVSHGKEYGTNTPVSTEKSRPDMVDPLWVWDPSIAPSGMAFYPDNASHFPELQGTLLVGSLKFQRLYALTLSEDGHPLSERVILDGDLGRIRDVAVSDEGVIYLINDAHAGGLYRLTNNK